VCHSLSSVHEGLCDEGVPESGALVTPGQVGCLISFGRGKQVEKGQAVCRMIELTKISTIEVQIRSFPTVFLQHLLQMIHCEWKVIEMRV
jgi:hypothetical protein